MPLPCPGPAPISLLDIQNEFGGSYLDGTYTQIKEYYRGGGYVPNNDANTNIPTSGQISFDQFFCSSGEIVVYITQDTANVNVQSLFGNNWTRLIPKRLVINSGVRVYNTNPYEISNLNGYAMRIYDTFNGKLTIQNFGSIQGAAGRRGGDTIVTGESRTNQSNGGQGGNAIYIGPTTYGTSGNGKIVYIDNQGTIYAGGGGGGKGGSNTSGSSTIVDSRFWPQVTGNPGCCPLDIRLVALGGSGGLGGWGQGYNQSNTSGSAGLAAGVEATISMTSLGGNSFRFPPNSDITINANNSGQATHYFSSNSTIRYNMNNSGTSGGLSFAGSNNSITLKRTNSGFSGTLTKDPNQSYTDNAINSGFTGRVNNVPGGGPEQTSGQVTIIANGFGQVFSLSAGGSGGTGGDGATWGNTGATGNDGGSSGGASGYAIANRSQYVSYINQGTIAGQTT